MTPYIVIGFLVGAIVSWLAAACYARRLLRQAGKRYRYLKYDYDNLEAARNHWNKRFREQCVTIAALRAELAKVPARGSDGRMIKREG